MNKDAKHLMKRIRNRAIGPGYEIGPCVYNKALLLRFLDDHNVPSAMGILKPADKQNVAMAHKFTVNIASSGRKHESEFVDDGLVKFLPEYRVLGRILDCLCSLYAKYNDNLHTALVELSEAAHLLLAVYQHSGVKFIPSQLYYDFQGPIQDIYSSVAKLQVWSPEHKVHLYQMGSDECEVLFSIFRTITHDRNCDLMQLQERLSHSATMKQIFMKHKDMRTNVAKRLNIREGVDHTNTTNWIGDIRACSVDLQVSWKYGRTKAEAILKNCK